MKKVVKATLFAFILFFTVINANAQFATSSTYGLNGTGEAGWRMGIKIGPNFAGFTGKGAKELDGKIGMHIGYFAEYVMPSNLFIQTGLELSLKGAKYEESYDGDKYKVKANPMYLQVPVHLGYQIGLADDISVNIHVGPYLAFGIAGKWKATEEYEGHKETEDWNFFDSEEKGGAKAFDFGLGFGADVDISSFRVGLGYDAGLVNIDRDKDYPVKNRNFYISVGYKF